ncbi:hypothetical protein BDV06DRAFT_124335 [Aspergillus oleicola]
MAEVLLELWKLDFDKIGCLGKEVNGQIAVTGRPLTRELNELIRVSGLSSDCTPQRAYYTPTEYIASLLQLQSTQLEKQRNSVYNSQGCREKYTCRYLMKAIGPSFIPSEDHGPFKLFCDDFHPGNVLVDDSLRIVGVLDWEFSYAAPSQFASAIPWWLLLQRPDSLVDDVGSATFLKTFLPKAAIFIEALEERETARGLDNHGQLSVRMRQSIEDRSVWFTLACHMVSSVDLLYWNLLDEYCWGPRTCIADRVHSITTTPKLHKGREDLVCSKIKRLQDYYQELSEEHDVEYEPEEMN